MNTIAANIADFLKQYPPFDNLRFEELSEIATNIRVLSLEKNKTLFSINDTLHDSFYVVASGAINLSIISDAEENLLNKCIEGDIFGLRPFFAKNNYMMTAKARKESIIYAIPIVLFQSYVKNNSRVLEFILHSFASNTSNPTENRNLHGAAISDQQSEVQYFQTLSYNTNPLIVSEINIIKEVAQLMTNAIVDNSIVCEKNFPIGIVTNSDMTTKIATGKFPISSTVNKIMSAPVVTVLPNVSLAEAQLLMLKYNVSHLCVTEDGTDKSIVKGVISQSDLIAAQASNPGVLIKEVKRSQSAKDLNIIRERLTDLIRRGVLKNIPISHINTIASDVNTEIIKRAVELAILDLGSPPVQFAYLVIGSQGRREQLLTTDQDSILIFEDVPADQYRDVKDYFLKLGKRTTATLEKVGFELCPNGHVASNMTWCKSMSDWTKQYTNWINTPGENSNEISSVFFDFEIAYGEPKIEEAIKEVIFSNAKDNTLFFDFLGNDALRKNAPLSFFKKFNLEEEGANIDKFDIKTRALMPLIDSARLFTLSYGIRGINNTYLRFKQLAIVDPKNKEIYLDCAEAFLTLSNFKTLEGLKNDNSGQFININELLKSDRENLKNALAPMRELEELIKSKFQLTQFS